MDFVKMQGAGNDFVLVDCVAAECAPEALQKRASALCDRRFGIGSDGVLAVCRSESGRLRMVMYNPDGSEGMCGNGLRCVAKYACESGLTHDVKFPIETVGGVVNVELILAAADRSKGMVAAVRADMGHPALTRAEIPMAGPPDERVVDKTLSVDGDWINVTCVSMGNPHCVIFVEDVDAVPLEEFGRQIENHPAFPSRTNVEFVEIVQPSALKVRVWERGAGATLACGTGACATVVAGVLAGKCERHCTVNLPGGALDVEWAADDHVFMTGPAETVFKGSIEI